MRNKLVLVYEKHLNLSTYFMLLLCQEEKLRKVDAKKAAQVERLGMGASSSKSGIGHSVMNQMNTIVQVRNIHLLTYVGF